MLGHRESIEITKTPDSIQVAGGGDSVEIRKDSGLAGGISKELTNLSAQQASEARTCTQKYLAQLLDIILKDDQGGPSRSAGSDQVATVRAAVPTPLASPGHAGWMRSDTGCYVWNEAPNKNETVTWTGGCDAVGLAQGSGIMTWRTNGVETVHTDGMWRDGKMNGHGVEVIANGGRYEGEYRDDLRNGRGLMIWPTGDRYEGEFVDGVMTGHGVEVWANGNRYVGSWRNNLPDGVGELVLPNGKDHYNGVWTKGCLKHGGHWTVLETTQAACGS